MRFDDLILILQGAVSPVILISGGALIILSMTNRFGRVLDRSRLLNDALRIAPQQERQRLKSQLEILFRRARILRSALNFAVVSVLAAAVLVISLFLVAFLHVEVVLLCVILFIVCSVSLIISLLAFLKNINLSRAALKLELIIRDNHAA